jgi:hypothetical protein
VTARRLFGALGAIALAALLLTAEFAAQTGTRQALRATAARRNNQMHTLLDQVGFAHIQGLLNA